MAEDVALLKLLFGQGPSFATRTHANLLNRLMLPFQFADQVKYDPRGAVIVAALDDYASNVLDDYHASFRRGPSGSLKPPRPT